MAAGVSAGVSTVSSSGSSAFFSSFLCEVSFSYDWINQAPATFPQASLQQTSPQPVPVSAPVPARS